MGFQSKLRLQTFLDAKQLAKCKTNREGYRQAETSTVPSPAICCLLFVRSSYGHTGLKRHRSLILRFDDVGADEGFHRMTDVLLQTYKESDDKLDDSCLRP